MDLSKYKKIRQRWVDETVSVKLTDVPEILYHYTDAAGLYGMLMNHQIWLSDYRFLNDTTEFKHIYSILSLFKRDHLRQKSPDAWKRKILAGVSEESKVMTDSYVFSLSTERDDLSQWRGYAKEGLGFTIGFDATYIADLAQPDDADFAFVKVDYDGSQQLTVFNRLLSELASQVASDVKAGVAEDKALEAAVITFDDVCANRGALSKHGSFRSENEWRIVSYLGSEEQSLRRVRVSGNRLISYMEGSIKTPDGKLPVKSIGVGPANRGTEVIDAVKTLIRMSGHDAEIYFADTPFRSTS